MKKVFIILLSLGILFSSTSLVFSKESPNNSISFTLNYSSPLIKQSLTNNEVEIVHESCESSFLKPGYYIIPKDIKTLYFPKGTIINNIDVVPTRTSNRIIDQSLPICPQPIALNMQSQPTNSNETIVPLTIDTWYDYRVGTGIEDGERQVILSIDIYPNRYNPDKKSVITAEEIEVTIDYTPSEQTLSDETFNLVIITPDEFADSLQDLVDHKNSNDMLTKLVSLEEIYNGNYFPNQGNDEQEQIKYFIKNAIESWNIESVLLVGSAEKMPVRETHIQVSANDKEIFVSDLYYADIYNNTDGFSSWDTNNNGIYAEFNWEGETDEMDLYPDVYLGRLACTDQNEVNTVVNKIISYENNEAYKQDWFSDLIVIGGDSFPGDNNQILEGEYVNDEVIRIMDGFLPSRLWASNGILGGASPSGVSAISNRINEGAGFIDFSGHGNTNVWATHPHENSNVWLPTPFGGYLSTHIKNLENANKLPIVVTGACSVGKFNKDDDCFSWSIVASENGGGIASFGSTGLGYAYTGESVTYGLIEKLAVDMFRSYQNKVQTFGEMWSWGLHRNIGRRMDAFDHKTVMEWQPFGDPTLKISADSEKPEKPIVNGPTSGKSEREYQYEATSTNPESSELYYAFSWGDGTYSEWLGPFSSGETVTATHTWEEQGEYEVKVAVKNEDGKHSDWSDPLPISMPLHYEPHYPILFKIGNWFTERFNISIFQFSYFLSIK